MLRGNTRTTQRHGLRQRNVSVVQSVYNDLGGAELSTIRATTRRNPKIKPLQFLTDIFSVGEVSVEDEETSIELADNHHTFRTKRTSKSRKMTADVVRRVLSGLQSRDTFERDNLSSENRLLLEPEDLGCTLNSVSDGQMKCAVDENNFHQGNKDGRPEIEENLDHQCAETTLSFLGLAVHNVDIDTPDLDYDHVHSDQCDEDHFNPVDIVLRTCLPLQSCIDDVITCPPEHQSDCMQHTSSPCRNSSHYFQRQNADVVNNPSKVDVDNCTKPLVKLKSTTGDARFAGNILDLSSTDVSTSDNQSVSESQTVEKRINLFSVLLADTPLISELKAVVLVPETPQVEQGLPCRQRMLLRTKRISKLNICSVRISE